ncbi:MAG: FtsB family cell division protein [Luteibaculaceae bacterium]
MKKIIAKLKLVLPYLRWMRNKYKLTAFILLVWISFFDTYDIISMISNKKKLRLVEQDIQFYKKEIEETNADLYNLTTNTENLEKFAREMYLMKKADEDIFIIVAED